MESAASSTRTCAPRRLCEHGGHARSAPSAHRRRRGRGPRDAPRAAGPGRRAHDPRPADPGGGVRLPPDGGRRAVRPRPRQTPPPGRDRRGPRRRARRGQPRRRGRRRRRGDHRRRPPHRLRRARDRRRGEQRARAAAGADVDAGVRRRRLRRAAARPRGGLQQAGRVRHPGGRRVAAAGLRARADDVMGGPRHGPERRRDHGLHARARAAGALRRGRLARAARRPRRRRRQGRDERVRHRRRRRQPRRRAGTAAAARAARRRAAAGGRPPDPRPAQRRSRVRALQPLRPGRRPRQRLGRGRRDDVPGQAGRPRGADGGRRRPGDRRPRRRPGRRPSRSGPSCAGSF